MRREQDKREAHSNDGNDRRPGDKDRPKDAPEGQGEIAPLLVRIATKEDDFVDEAKQILKHPDFGKLRDAHEKGDTVVVRINGREIQYEPGLSSSGFTNHEAGGFLIGPEAFTISRDEMKKTVLQELFRLHLGMPSEGVSGDFA